MKKSNPISLFSFQDIITSLTGIMIVIVLVILLQLVESAAAIAAKTEKLPEIIALKKEQAELIQRRERLEEALKNGNRDHIPLSNLSLPELNIQIRKEQTAILTVRKQIASVEQELQKQNLELKNLLEKIKSVQNQIKELQKDEMKNREQLAILLALQQRRKEIEEQIEAKRKILRFEFSGLAGKTPILIECNSWGFRAKIHPDGELVSFGSSKTKGPSQINALMQWLGSFSSKNYYPVFLFREDALPFHDSVLNAYYRTNPDPEIGREPIADGEECF